MQTWAESLEELRDRSRKKLYYFQQPFNMTAPSLLSGENGAGKELLNELS